MIKGPTPKPEGQPVTEGGVELSTLSVARGWLALQKYSLTRGTRVLVVATGLIVTLLISATIAFLALSWMRDASALETAQQAVSVQQSQISKLEMNYTALYSEYLGVGRGVPKSPPPSKSDAADSLLCPTGTVLKDLTVTTLTEGTKTFLACQVSGF